jgi:guanylate kinase
LNEQGQAHAPPLRRGSLIVISAPSGTGKSSLVKRLVASVRDIVFSVSATTRSPRSGEADGTDYHFMDRARFESLIARGELLEHAEVHGNLYGTLRAPVDRERAAGRDVLLDIDVQGAAQVLAADRGAHLVFIAPPSRDELERRIRSRGLDAPEVIAARLVNAAGEMKEIDRFHRVVINDDLDRAVTEIETIVLARRLTPDAQRPRISSILATFGLPPGLLRLGDG